MQFINSIVSSNAIDFKSWCFYFTIVESTLEKTKSNSSCRSVCWWYNPKILLQQNLIHLVGAHLDKTGRFAHENLTDNNPIHSNSASAVPNVIF